MKKPVSLALALLLLLGSLTACGAGAKKTEGIDGWAADSPAMQSIVSFVTASADEKSAGFIPREDRVAVFDMDGTLYGERFPTYFNDWLFIQRALYDDSYEAPEELKDFARAWEDKVLRGVPIEDFDAKERALGPQLYEGLTPDAYADVVRRFKALPVWGFEGMTYGEAFFQPMVSLVQYLSEHDYTVYIVSATYRDAVRVMTEGTLDPYIPAGHVIGTDLLYAATGDEKQDSTFYELEPEDELVIAGRLFIKNQKTNKAAVIQREIGKMPVLAFGNSTGDFSMATYTLQNKKYDAAAYMLLCDDTERDYGDAEVAAAFKEKCDARGFHTVSMKDEFTTIYPSAARRMAAKPEAPQQSAAAGQKTALSADRIPGWTEDSPALASITAFVKAVTDESSPDYLPPEERIALFDSDGTLIGERYPTYSDQCMLLRRLLHDDSVTDTPADDAAFARALEEAIEKREPLPSSPRSTAQMAAESFKGFTVEEYRAYVREFLKQDVPGFTNMTYGERFFVPMVHLVQYLAEHDFRVFICSGTERLFLRELAADTLGQWIPPYRIIGSTFSLTATGQGEIGRAHV